MRQHKRYRGVSLGTIVMLVLTFCVCGGCSYVFSRLMGDVSVDIDTGKVLDALNLSDALPELSFRHIPLGTTEQPTEIVETLAPLASIAPPAEQEPTMAPSSTPVPTTPPGGSFTLTLAGSINMDDAITKSGYYSDSGKYDFSDTLSLISDETESDLTMVSLENLIIPDSKISSLNAPAEVTEMLKVFGADVVALGHTQVMDKSLPGLSHTIEALDDAGLDVIGAYATPEERQEPRIFTLNNVRVALLHYTEDLSNSGQSAVKKEDCSYAVTVADEQQIIQDISSVRSRGAQVIIVSMNWGSSGKATPTTAQTKLAQQLADAGVDVIVGTGTRVVQPVVWLTGRKPDGSPKHTLCAYSLGSLINESRKDGNVASLLLQLTISFDGSDNVSFTQTAYTPTYIWRYKLDNKYYYRVVASDQEAPDGMSDEQTAYKNKAFTNIQKKLADSPLKLR